MMFHKAALITVFLDRHKFILSDHGYKVSALHSVSVKPQLLLLFVAPNHRYDQPDQDELVTYCTYRMGQKNRTCLSIDNSAMVSGRKSCDTSKVSECCKE